MCNELDNEIVEKYIDKFWTNVGRRVELTGIGYAESVELETFWVSYYGLGKYVGMGDILKCGDKRPLIFF